MYILREVFKCNEADHKSEVFASEMYAAMYSNLLLMYDIALFCNFYYKKIMDAILQIYFLKVRLFFVHLVLFLHYGISFWRSLYVFLNLISFGYLIFGTQALVAESYHEDNRRYTCDYTSIMFNILDRAISSLKFVMMFKFIFMIYLYLRFGLITPYFCYGNFKLLIYIIDYLLYRTIKDRVWFYKCSTYLFSLLAIPAIIFLLYYYFYAEVEDEIKYIVSEIETAMIFCFLLYMTYVTKSGVSENEKMID